MKRCRNVIGKFWPLANPDRNLEIHYPSSIRDDLESRFARGWNHRVGERRNKVGERGGYLLLLGDRLFAYLRVYISPLTTRSLVKLWYNRNINRAYHSCPALSVTRPTYTPKDKSRANVVSLSRFWESVARSGINVGQRVRVWIRKARINTLISGRYRNNPPVPSASFIFGSAEGRRPSINPIPDRSIGAAISSEERWGKGLRIRRVREGCV